MDKDKLWENLNHKGLWRAKLNEYMDKGMPESVCRRLYGENFNPNKDYKYYFNIWENYYEQNKDSFIPVSYDHERAEIKRQADSIREAKGVKSKSFVEMVKEAFKDVPAQVTEDNQGITVQSVPRETKLNIDALSKEELIALIKKIV